MSALATLHMETCDWSQITSGSRHLMQNLHLVARARLCLVGIAMKLGHPVRKVLR